MASPSPRTRGRDLYARLAEWVGADAVGPDLSDRMERFWRETDLPSLRQLTERFQWDVEWPSLRELVERLQSDGGWARLTDKLDRLHAELDFPNLSALSDKLQLNFDLPEFSAPLTPQHRQALRGVLLLGMVLHTAPAPHTKLTPPVTGGRTAIAEMLGATPRTQPRQAYELRAAPQDVATDAALRVPSSPAPFAVAPIIAFPPSLPTANLPPSTQALHGPSPSPRRLGARGPPV